MADAKHTPGEWFPAEDFSMVFARGMLNDADVCEVFAGGGGTMEGNARLIAAAPETAAERDRLKEINAELVAYTIEAEAGIRDAVRIMDLMGRGGDARELARCGNNLRAAISKATGGAP